MVTRCDSRSYRRQLVATQRVEYQHHFRSVRPMHVDNSGEYEQTVRAAQLETPKFHLTDGELHQHLRR